MIKDGDKFVNPNKIENTKTYVVNTGIIQVNQYLAGPDGKPSSVLGEPESVYGTIGEETVIKPFESKYYDPVSGEVKAVIQENRTSIDMLYKKNEEKTPDNVKIDLIHAKDYPLDQPANNPYGLVSKSYGNKYPFILKLDLSGKWNFTFEGLYKFENGKEIKYTITEDKVAGYETEIKGYDITNIHEPKKDVSPAKPDKPEKPEKPSKPTTGDSQDMTLPLIGIIASGILIDVIRRRKSMG